MTEPIIPFWETLPGALIPAIPSIVVWTAVLVASIILLRRGGGNPEKFLVMGSVLLLTSGILIIVNFQIQMMFLHDIEGRNNFLFEGFKWLREAVRMAGVICFLYAFWIKFNEGKTMALSADKDNGNQISNTRENLT